MKEVQVDNLKNLTEKLINNSVDRNGNSGPQLNGVLMDVNLLWQQTNLRHSVRDDLEVLNSANTSFSNDL